MNDEPALIADFSKDEPVITYPKKPPSPEEKLANLKLQEKKLRAKLQKLQQKKDEFSDDGKMRKYRARILIQAGLALTHYLKGQLRDNHARLSELLNQGQKLSRQSAPKEEIDKVQQNVKHEANIIQNRSRELYRQYFTAYFDSCEKAAKATSDPKKRERALKANEENKNLCNILMNKIQANQFK